MLWLYLYISCAIIIGIVLLFTVYSDYDSLNRTQNYEAIGLLFFSPIVLVILLFGILVELVVYIVPKIRYFSRFWIKQTIGIMISDVRWVCAVNGKLQTEKKPVVYKSCSNGELIDAGDDIYTKQSTLRVYPIKGGVVCHYDEMKFMVDSLLNKTIPFFSFNKIYNIAIPCVTSSSEINVLQYSFGAKKIEPIPIPKVISYILNESNFGLIYFAHSFTEISIVENNSVKYTTFENIGLDDLAISIIKGVCPSVKTSLDFRRHAFESLTNEHFSKLYGPDINTYLPLEVLLTLSDLQTYSKQWISSIVNSLTKLPTPNIKWFAIGDYGNLNDIAALINEECSVKIQPINNSQELIAKELSRTGI